MQANRSNGTTRVRPNARRCCWMEARTLPHRSEKGLRVLIMIRCAVSDHGEDPRRAVDLIVLIYRSLEINDCDRDETALNLTAGASHIERRSRQLVIATSFWRALLHEWGPTTRVEGGTVISGPRS